MGNLDEDVPALSPIAPVSAADKSGLATKDILEKSNLMLLEKNNITRTHIDDYLESEGIHPQQILEVNNMDLLIDLQLSVWVLPVSYGSLRRTIWLPGRS